MSVVENLIAVRDANGLVAALEKGETEVRKYEEEYEDANLYSWFTQAAGDGTLPKYAMQMIAYLLIGDLDRARLLHRRVPTKEMERNVELRVNNNTNHIWSVATHMLASQRSDAYAKLTNQQWSNALSPLVVWLVESYRDRNAALLARAYSNVSLRVAAPALGLNSSDAGDFLTGRGWTRQEDVFVAPVAAPVDPAVHAAIAHKQKITAEEVSRLADQVLFVEQ